MLAGLAAIALPFLAHLLSKKRYDIVQWGAMQFLELGHRTRRRIRLEEFLLLLLRMGMIGVLVLALARPWLAGGLFNTLGATPARDVVLVIDGSYSMQRQVQGISMHAAALEWAHSWIDGLNPGDTVTLIDARSRPRVLFDGPTTDLGLVRRELDNFASPGSTSDLAGALMTSLRILSTTTNLSREVIVLTDNQKLPWSVDDARLWRLVDESRQQPAVTPRLILVDLSEGMEEMGANFTVDPIELSRELTAPDFPVRISATIRQSGGATAQRQIYFEVNGQRLVDQTLTVSIPGDGQTTIEFEHRFSQPGSYVVGVSLDEDDLSGDDRSEAAVNVAEGTPVLIVDGDPQAEAVRSESFFLKTAFRLSGQRATLVDVAVSNWDRWTQDDLTGRSVVFLLNVPSLSAEQWGWLRDFVDQGGGLVVAPGDRTSADDWNSQFAGDESPLFPVQLGERVSADPESADTTLRMVRVANESLQVPWMHRFRADNGVDFHLIRFGQWWQLLNPETPTVESEDIVDEVPSAVVAASLTSGDPLLVTGSYGQGHVVVLAAPLDADWSTWPSNIDYLPFVHELTFLLARSQSARNLEAGTPMVWFPRPGEEVEFDRETIEVRNPEGDVIEPRLIGSEESPRLVIEDTTLPGVYRWIDSSHPERLPDVYVVRDDRGESMLTSLADEDLETLTANDRIQPVETMDEALALQDREQIRSEVWRWLMVAVLGMLVVELFMTRHLVKKGHEDVEPSPA